MTNGAKRPTIKKAPTPPVADWLQQWLTIRDEAARLEDRIAVLRSRLMDSINEMGDEDDKGSTFLELTTPVEFQDHEGRTFKYTTLKRERHLRPANPMPDPDKAEALLRELGLWISKADEKTLRNLQMANPYVYISVSVDPDAVAQAYFKGVIDEDRYDACLVEQKESFQFRPGE